MLPHFDLQEAREMLGLAYAVCLVGPGDAVVQKIDGKKKLEGFRNVTPIANDPSNPVTNDDGKTFAYPVAPIWPKGWTPGTPVAKSKKNANVWDESIIATSPMDIPLLNLIPKFKQYIEKAQYKLGTNNVIFAKNEARNAYVVAFAGTQNIIGAIEDLVCDQVSARGNLSLDYKLPKPLGKITFGSTANYVLHPEYYDYEPSDKEPRVVEPLMHLGIRLAVESYTVHASPKHSLIDRIKKAAGLKKEINLYVTGHSLGGGMAHAFTAWLQAGGIPGIKVNVKMYSFASPKIFNDVAAANFDGGLTQRGYALRVYNTLDTVPQLGFTFEFLKTLQNPGMVLDAVASIEKLFSKKGDSTELDPEIADLVPSATIKKFKLLKEAAALLQGAAPNMNYVHFGNARPIMGSYPVVFQGASMPESYYPNGKSPDSFPKSDSWPMITSWWQHWPWVYYDAMV